MNKAKRTFSLVAAGMAAVTALSGCSGKTGGGETDKLTLKYWCGLPGTVSTVVTNLGETDFYKELEQRTGVHIEFIHPSAGSVKEQFNVLVASRDFPDIMEYDWSSYPGAERKASLDGVVADVTDYMKDNAPHILSFVNDKAPKIKKRVTTDDRWYIIPSMLDFPEYNCVKGTLIRQDLLDKFNLQMPETIDEWENVLRTFKNGGVKYPLCLRSSDITSYCQFISAYDVATTFYQDSGKIKYGYFEPSMKEFLAKINSWISEGLVDPDIMTMDGSSFDSKVLNGEVGAWVDTISEMKHKTAEIRKVAPDAKIVGAPYQTLTKGAQNKFYYFERVDGYTYQNEAAITTANKHIPETLKWFDYAFTDEGHMLYNFGVEGKSYTMVDGKPKYTDLITNNPDGHAMRTALGLFARPEAPGYVDVGYYDQYYDMPEQQAAAKMWSDEAAKVEQAVVWRACYKLNDEEADKVSELLPQFTSFASENFAKFVTGVTPLSDYDKFTAELSKLGANEVMGIYQTAYDRLK